MKKKEEEQSAKLIRCGSGLVAWGRGRAGWFALSSAGGVGGHFRRTGRGGADVSAHHRGMCAGGLCGRPAGSAALWDRALIVGLTTGGVLFLLLLTIGALCFETVSLEAGGIGLLCGSLCGGAAAGILGGGGKKKPARKKRRK